MFAYTNVASCQCIIRRNIYNFMKHMENFSNYIIHSIVKVTLSICLCCGNKSTILIILISSGFYTNYS